MSVSIIICTYNRERDLERVLKSLLQKCSTASADIVVVDNGSTDDTSRVCDQYSSSGVRRIFEPVKGLSQARNAGIAASTADIVVFIDDDVEVRDGWLANLVSPFDNPKVGVVGGELEPVWGANRPVWLDGHRARSYSVLLRWSDRWEDPRPSRTCCGRPAPSAEGCRENCPRSLAIVESIPPDLRPISRPTRR